MNLIQSYLQPLFVGEWDNEPTLSKKADNSNFVGDATNLDSLPKAYKTSETKKFFPHLWLNHPDKLNDKKLPPYEVYHNELRNSNSFEKKYLDYEKLIGSGLTTDSLCVKMRCSEVPPTRAEKNPHWQKKWEQENWSHSMIFFRLHKIKEVVLTLEAMQKMVEFYHNKGIDMLNPGCTLLNRANICMHSSTSGKYYPLTESDKNILPRVRAVMVGGPSIVFTGKISVDEAHIRRSPKVCKSNIGKDPS